MELQEAAQIHTGLQPPNVGRSTSLHDMKAIVKTWRLEASPSNIFIHNCFYSTTSKFVY